MSCPLLGASRPACRAVDGPPVPPGREVLAAYCRGDHERCPAFRYVRATGRRLNPADFAAWVVRGIAPGRTDPDADRPDSP